MSEFENVKVGYKLGGLFEDLGMYNRIGFEILFPHVYESMLEAEEYNGSISAKMEKRDNEVVICLYEKGNVVDVIHWDEWQKYKCIRIKYEKKDAVCVNANADYEPYAEKFEEIFKDYCGTQERSTWPMQYLVYWIEPVIISK